MNPEHVARMENELIELTDRAKKLTTFVNESPIFAGLASIDQCLMVQQLAAMHQYGGTLALRVRRAASNETGAAPAGDDSGDNSPAPPHP